MSGTPSAGKRPPMITFHYNLPPNPMKVALCLEEMGLDYSVT